MIIEQVGEVIYKLKTLAPNDIFGKVELNEELAALCWDLSDEVGRAYEDMKNKEYFLKKSIAGFEATWKGPANKAKSQALVAYDSLWKDSVDAENYYKKLQLLRDSAVVVIEQTRQSISYLKQEKR